MSNKPFHHIALIGRARKEIADTLEAVKDYLIQKKTNGLYRRKYR